jgi:hypothetical protein
MSASFSLAFRLYFYPEFVPVTLLGGCHSTFCSESGRARFFDSTATAGLTRGASDGEDSGAANEVPCRVIRTGNSSIDLSLASYGLEANIIDIRVGQVGVAALIVAVATRATTRVVTVRAVIDQLVTSRSVSLGGTIIACGLWLRRTRAARGVGRIESA